MAKKKRKQRKSWSEANYCYLEDHAGRKSARSIAAYLRRTEGAVRQKACALGISLETRV